MRLSIFFLLITFTFICSCSDKQYTEELDQSDWLALYDHMSMDENIDAVKKKFPAIKDWRPEVKEGKDYLWTVQKIFDTDAYVAFIFKEQVLYQVKIYLQGLSEENSEKLFHSLKQKYSESIESSKQFCNQQNSRYESCFWLIDGMTIYLKYIDDNEDTLILFGFQQR